MRKKVVLGLLAMLCCSAGLAHAQPALMVGRPDDNLTPVQKTEATTPGRLADTVNLTDQQRRRLSSAGELAIYGPGIPISKEQVAAMKESRRGPSSAAPLSPAPFTIFPASGTVNNRNYWGESYYSTVITQSEASSAVYSKHVIVGWNDIESYYFGGYHSWSNWAVSHNGGTSFTDKLTGLPTYSTITKTFGDPAIAVDPTTGYFYYATMAQLTVSGINYSAVAVYRSTDHGETFTLWNPGYGLAYAWTSDTSAFLDKEAIAINPTNGKVHVTFTYFASSSPYYWIYEFNVTDGFLQTITSTDGLAYDGLQGSSPAFDRNGNLYVAYEYWNTLGYPYILIQESPNDGASFYSPVVVRQISGVADDDASSFCGFLEGIPSRDAIKGNIRLIEFPSLAIDIRSSGTGAGNLYITYNARNTHTDNIDVFLTKSTDGGTTWSTPIIAGARPTGDTSDKFMPWVTVNKLGEVAVLYYDRRNHPGVTGFDNSNWWITTYLRRYDPLLGIIGTDKLGSAFPVVVNNDYTGACYMGDYNSVSANRSHNSTDTYFYVFRGDNGFGDPDIKFSKVAP